MLLELSCLLVLLLVLLLRLCIRTVLRRGAQTWRGHATRAVYRRVAAGCAACVDRISPHLLHERPTQLTGMQLHGDGPICAWQQRRLYGLYELVHDQCSANVLRVPGERRCMRWQWRVALHTIACDSSTASPRRINQRTSAARVKTLK